MVIKRQRVNGSNALVEVEADPTDTVNTNGTLDQIVTSGVKTAKFPNTNPMQANSGLKIGLLKHSITCVSQIPLGEVISNPEEITNPQNLIDNNPLTSTGTFSVIGQRDIWVVDFGSIITARVRSRLTFFVSSLSKCSTAFSTTNNINDYFPVFTQEASTIVTLDNTSAEEFTFQFLKMTYGGPNTTGENINWKLLGVVAGPASGVNINVRSSTALDTANGTIMAVEFATANATTIFNTDLLITDPSGFVTFEVSSPSIPQNVTGSAMTTIKEEP